MRTRGIHSAILLALTLGFGITSFGQMEIGEDETFLVNSANDFIQFEDYESARELFQVLDSLRPNTPNYIFNLALCSFHVKDKPGSLLFFLKAYNLGYQEKVILYYIGLAYQYNYDLDNAEYYLKKYQEASEDQKPIDVDKLQEVNHILEQLSESKKILDKRLSVDVKSLGEGINSPSADYVPMAIKGDSIMIFTSRRSGSTGGRIAHDGSHYEDIYMTRKGKDGTWEQPVPFPGLNSKHHDANVAINRNETELYVYKVKRKGDIYRSVRKQNGTWTKPRPVKGINSRFWEGSICLSPGEDTIFFSSDRPGGFGGSDLYFATRKRSGANWSGVQNMGKEINTSLDEDAPYIHKDGRTFFFSSRGHNSIGGYDVFSIKLAKDGWRDLKNLGFPVNTMDDDIYFHLNAQASLGYFTSFRHSNFKEKSVGEKDLFQIVRPHSSPVYFVFKGQVYDAQSKEPIPAIVTIQNMEDSLSKKESLVVDINTGKFRYDLEFERHYKLTVDVGGKTYFSKELYYPYQPELFESFLDIPLKDIPTFKMKLNDVLMTQAEDTEVSQVLDDAKQSTIVLVRKVPYDDPDLQKLLLSNKIPVSFRRKIVDQLKGTDYLDKPEEGERTENVFQELGMDENVDFTKPLDRLQQDEHTDVDRWNVKDFLKSPGPDTVTRKLSADEKEIIERLTDFVTGEQPFDSLKIIDELYYNNLAPEELEEISKIAARRVLQENKNADTDQLLQLIDYNRNALLKKKQNLPGFSAEAWGILYTIEASKFRYNSKKSLQFKGKVTHRNDLSDAQNLRLILVDDLGMIYSDKATSANGEIEFQDVLPGRRYHVLVDDYAIVLIGQSRYQMSEVSITSSDDDFWNFYNTLKPEEKRSVDRLIAKKILQEENQNHLVADQEVHAELGRMPKEDSVFLAGLIGYFSAKESSDTCFFIREQFALKYKQLDFKLREKFNRLVSERVPVHAEDSLFFGKLSDLEKGFIERIKDSRKAKRILTEDILTSTEDADFWYTLDEINTTIHPRTEMVKVSGRVFKKSTNGRDQLLVSLVDEYNQIISVNQTDSLGRFFVPSVVANKKYKVLIKKGRNIKNMDDYALTEIVVEGAEPDFYSKLSATEKRMIDRIIALNLANEAYKDAELQDADLKRFQSLSSEEKDLIERLRKHLFADTVTNSNLHLQRFDNHQYYTNLTISDRDFINRLIARERIDSRLQGGPVSLKKRDKVFYDKLTENQKNFVKDMQRQRKANSDIFVENPVLVIDKSWVVLDSITVESPKHTAKLQGKIVDERTGNPASGVPVMVSDKAGNMKGIITTDSTGSFLFKSIDVADELYVLAESKRIFFSENYIYRVTGLSIEFLENDSIQVVVRNRTDDQLIIYFDFDSFNVSALSVSELLQWAKAHGSPIKIVVEGHTDHVGPDEYNLKLSRKRAESVKRVLIGGGIESQDIVVRWQGERKPLFKAKNVYRNRRVEVSGQ